MDLRRVLLFSVLLLIAGWNCTLSSSPFSSNSTNSTNSTTSTRSTNSTRSIGSTNSTRSIGSTNSTRSISSTPPSDSLPDSTCEDASLQAYKVATALLCCVLLILLLLRLTRPSIRALQRRLSDRRQNRWIGPTQSHSVSYHRGKAAVRGADAENRLSYSALDRLAVGFSRDPPSSRNSYNL